MSDHRVIALAGRLDATSTPDLRAEIDASLMITARLVINMDAVSYMSSSALRVLLGALKRARKAGGDVVLCCLHQDVLDEVQTVGFDRLFRIGESQELAEKLVMTPPIPAGPASRRQAA